jgi:hypothetical protein
MNTAHSKWPCQLNNVTSWFQAGMPFTPATMAHVVYYIVMTTIAIVMANLCTERRPQWRQRQLNNIHTRNSYSGQSLRHSHQLRHLAFCQGYYTANQTEQPMQWLSTAGVCDAVCPLTLLHSTTSGRTWSSRHSGPQSSPPSHQPGSPARRPSRPDTTKAYTTVLALNGRHAFRPTYVYMHRSLSAPVSVWPSF